VRVTCLLTYCTKKVEKRSPKNGDNLAYERWKTRREDGSPTNLVSYHSTWTIEGELCIGFGFVAMAVTKLGRTKKGSRQVSTKHAFARKL
jgi:hypothetical protein